MNKKAIIVDGDVVSETDAQGNEMVAEDLSGFNFDLAENEEIFDPNKKLFKPNVKARHRNPTDPSKYVVYFGKYYDAGTALLTHDTSVIDTLLRLNRLSQLKKEDIEGMDETELEDVFNDEQQLDDLRNSEYYQRLVVSYCLLSPVLSPTQIQMALPKRVWYRLYEIFTEGVGNDVDVVDMFPDETEAEQTGTAA